MPGGHWHIARHWVKGRAGRAAGSLTAAAPAAPTTSPKLSPGLHGLPYAASLIEDRGFTALTCCFFAETAFANRMCPLA